MLYMFDDVLWIYRTIDDVITCARRHIPYYTGSDFCLIMACRRVPKAINH